MKTAVAASASGSRRGAVLSTTGGATVSGGSVGVCEGGDCVTGTRLASEHRSERQRARSGASGAERSEADERPWGGPNGGEAQGIRHMVHGQIGRAHV